MPDDELREAAWAYAERSAVEQGFPVEIEGPGALARLATLWASEARPVHLAIGGG